MEFTTALVTERPFLLLSPELWQGLQRAQEQHPHLANALKHISPLEIALHRSNFKTFRQDNSVGASPPFIFAESFKRKDWEYPVQNPAFFESSVLRLPAHAGL